MKIEELRRIERAIKHMPLTCYNPEIGYVYHRNKEVSIEEVRRKQVENYEIIMRTFSE